MDRVEEIEAAIHWAMACGFKVLRKLQPRVLGLAGLRATSIAKPAESSTNVAGSGTLLPGS